jgi:hypothetical protein
VTRASISVTRPDGGTAGTAGSTPLAARAQTPEERRAALDKRLNDSLTAFDAQLRKEQQKIAQERDARRAITLAELDSQSSGRSATGTNGGGARGSSTSDGSASAKRGGQARHDDAITVRAGDLQSDKSYAEAARIPGGNGLSAREVPDGNDDDIIARRLRRAAEQETDPELKERLWKEYVEYKKNTDAK